MTASVDRRAEPLALAGSKDSSLLLLRSQLRASGYPALGRIGCELDPSGKLCLRGDVPNFHLKQIALTLATQVFRSEPVSAEALHVRQS